MSLLATDTETTEIEVVEDVSPSIETRTPLSLYRADEGVLLIHPDRQGQHHLIYGTDGFLYQFDPNRAVDIGLVVEHLETSALPNWSPTATAPELKPSYELRRDAPEDDELVLACVAPHATFLPAVYTLGAYRLVAGATEHHDALPQLSPVVGWLPLPVDLEDFWS